MLNVEKDKIFESGINPQMVVKNVNLTSFHVGNLIIAAYIGSKKYFFDRCLIARSNISSFTSMIKSPHLLILL